MKLAFCPGREMFQLIDLVRVAAKSYSLRGPCRDKARGVCYQDVLTVACCPIFMSLVSRQTT